MFILHFVSKFSVTKLPIFQKESFDLNQSLKLCNNGHLRDTNHNIPDQLSFFCGSIKLIFAVKGGLKNVPSS
jgi:hypothetical protein